MARSDDTRLLRRLKLRFCSIPISTVYDKPSPWHYYASATTSRVTPLIMKLKECPY